MKDQNYGKRFEVPGGSGPAMLGLLLLVLLFVLVLMLKGI